MAFPKKVKRGDTVNMRLRFVDVDKRPVNMVDKEIWFTAKTNADDPDSAAVIQVRIQVPDTAEGRRGEVFLTVSSEDTVQPLGRYFYDIQRVIDGTPKDVKTHECGQFEITQDITQAN